MDNSVFFATRITGEDDVETKVFTASVDGQAIELFKEFKRFLKNGLGIIDAKKELHRVNEDKGYIFISAKYDDGGDYKLIKLSTASRAQLLTNSEKLEPLDLVFDDIKAIIECLTVNGDLNASKVGLSDDDKEANNVPLIFVSIIKNGHDSDAFFDGYFERFITNDPLLCNVVMKGDDKGKIAGFMNNKPIVGLVRNSPDESFEVLRKQIAVGTTEPFKELHALIESQTNSSTSLPLGSIKLLEYSKDNDGFLPSINKDHLGSSMVLTQCFLDAYLEITSRDLFFTLYDVNPINALQYAIYDVKAPKVEQYKLLGKPIIQIDSIGEAAILMQENSQENNFGINTLIDSFFKCLFVPGFETHRYFSQFIITTKFGTLIDLSSSRSDKSVSMNTSLEIGYPIISLEVSKISSRTTSHEDYLMITHSKNDGWLYSKLSSKNTGEYSGMSVTVFDNEEQAINKLTMDLASLIEESGGNYLSIQLQDIEETLDYFNVKKTSRSKPLLN